jgi:oxalate decarboxylase/phosphoglucose isomerase-like protein (cupin superfamily)
LEKKFMMKMINSSVLKEVMENASLMVMNTKYAIVIPTGSKHNIINIDKTDLKMYTLYAPPHHKDGILRPTKKEAEENEAEFDGKTTE